MTEEQIERRVEALVDALDRKFTSSGMTDEAYRTQLKAIDAWAQAEYRKIAA